MTFVDTTFCLRAFPDEAASASGPTVEIDSPRIFAFDGPWRVPEADESDFEDDALSESDDDDVSADAVDVVVVVVDDVLWLEEPEELEEVDEEDALGVLSFEAEDPEDVDGASIALVAAAVSPLYSDQS
jgi:hypothetical protein